MLLNVAVGLFLVSRDRARGLKLTLESLRWTTFKSWLNVGKYTLLEARLCQRIPPEGGPGLIGGQDESSSSSLNDPSPSSSDE